MGAVVGAPSIESYRNGAGAVPTTAPTRPPPAAAAAAAGVALSWAPSSSMADVAE
jgi:hypothetical protein